MNHPPILIHFNELRDRLVVWYSANHPNDSITKQDLRDLGYSIETMGDVYTVEGPELGKIKTSLEALYGISEGDRLKKEDTMNTAPISVHLNEDIDRIVVLNSSRHEQNKLAKDTLVKLGYQIQTMGNIYTIAGPDLGVLKGGLESVYGVSEDDRSVESLHEKEED